MQAPIRKIQEVDVVVNLYNIGDSTNDISYTYENATISYIKNTTAEGYVTKILDNYSCKSTLKSDLEIHFNYETVERIMYGVEEEISNKTNKGEAYEGILFVEVDL